MHYRELPAELAELLAVQVLDKLPLCLSSDPNVHLEENIDYVGLEFDLIRESHACSCPSETHTYSFIF